MQSKIMFDGESLWSFNNDSARNVTPLAVHSSIMLTIARVIFIATFNINGSMAQQRKILVLILVILIKVICLLMEKKS